MSSLRLNPRSSRILIALAAGALLLALILQAEWLLLPDWLQPAGHGVYRLAYALTLPTRAALVFLIPPDAHHSTLLQWALICFAAPFLYGGLWRGVLRRRRKHRDANPPAATPAGRRDFLIRSAASIGFISSGGMGGYATFIEPLSLRVRRYDIPVRGLPRELNGLRIVQISDTHHGPFIPLSQIEFAIERANALMPDLVVLTGDYVHRTSRAVPGGVGVMKQIRARLGVAAVLGNHDHWEGAGACRGEFERAGIPLVDNVRLFLTPEGLGQAPQPGRSLCVAGVGDLWEDDVNFERALQGVDPSIPRVLLSHNPDTAELVPPGIRIDLMFSGHTHGGQVRLPVVGAPLAPTRYGAKYLGGLCHGPVSPVIVSRGVGMAGLPLRLAVPPEIGLIVLSVA